MIEENCDDRCERSRCALDGRRGRWMREWMIIPISIEIYPQRRYFIHPTGDESTRGGSAARIGKDAKTTAIMGEK